MTQRSQVRVLPPLPVYKRPWGNPWGLFLWGAAEILARRHRPPVDSAFPHTTALTAFSPGDLAADNVDRVGRHARVLELAYDAHDLFRDHLLRLIGRAADMVGPDDTVKRE